MSEIYSYFVENWFEVVAALLGFVSIYLQIRQHHLYWPVSLVMVIMYIIIYFRAGLYADMLLQWYYVVVSIYGWYLWLKGKPAEASSALPVTFTSLKEAAFLFAFSVLSFFLLAYVLKNFTNSTVPYIDAFTTALSFTATWMLARKKIENWLVWIIADVTSVGLYFYKKLYPTMILFIFLSVLAVVGYKTWLKDLKSSHEKV
jgi:nicotinamide mononucleotide transporter